MSNDNFNLIEHIVEFNSKIRGYKLLLEAVLTRLGDEYYLSSFDVLGDDLEASMAELIRLAAK